MLSGVKPPETLLPALIVQRQVRADDLPAIAPVGGDVDVLTADVDLVVIVRRNQNREFPIEPVFHFGCRSAFRAFRPHFDIARLVLRSS